MDIINKVGSLLNPASLNPSARNPGNTAPAIQTANNASSDVMGTHRVLASGDIVASNKRMEMTGAVSSLNRSVQSIQRGIEFSVDEASGRSVVRIVDRETGDVIRQLPPEAVLAAARQIKEFLEVRQASVDSSGESDEALGFIMQAQA
ncbi:hypothetical protein MNBD_GAMMA26-982 [hydrothermal vent metagenome]|uniref:Flagellar protein FlaG n=1 Tax=hydrothermal vent metagenome TaxID=652676 RepID=A0A3B1B7G8_9ZZZZ